MKKFVVLLVIAVFVLMTACDYAPVEFKYNFNYAYIRLQNGEVIEGKVEKWTDYEGEQLQVTINGVVYLTNSFNCTLVYDEALE